jgi:hypothetical protein
MHASQFGQNATIPALDLLAIEKKVHTEAANPLRRTGHLKLLAT